MNVITILCIFVVICCVENGYAATSSECVGAFPPDPNSGCCGDDVTGSKLIGGSSTAIDQYPWLTLIEYKRIRDNQLKTLCGGTLISSKYVLTSAHCVTESALKIATPVNVRLGEYNTTSDGPDCVSVAGNDKDCTTGEVRIPIETIIPHPEYSVSDVSRRNDIALIRMKETAPFTDFIRPICLPTTDVTTGKGPISFTIAGWGTSYGPSNVVLRVDLPYVPQDECQKVYSAKVPNFTLWKGQICAGGEKGKDSCRGHGGLPLMYNNRGSFQVAGLVSFGGRPCGQENFPSIYTNVYEYKSWITSNIVA